MGMVCMYGIFLTIRDDLLRESAVDITIARAPDGLVRVVGIDLLCRLDTMVSVQHEDFQRCCELVGHFFTFGDARNCYLRQSCRHPADLTDSGHEILYRAGIRWPAVLGARDVLQGYSPLVESTITESICNSVNNRWRATPRGRRTHALPGPRPRVIAGGHEGLNTTLGEKRTATT